MLFPHAPNADVYRLESSLLQGQNDAITLSSADNRLPEHQTLPLSPLTLNLQPGAHARHQGTILVIKPHPDPACPRFGVYFRIDIIHSATPLTTGHVIQGQLHPVACLYSRKLAFKHFTDHPDFIERSDRQNPRSEEHTSELQSRENLVCRLLLEKKKR